jgi:23S rRNA pseudouridine1911/1915/1917 synthase
VRGRGARQARTHFEVAELLPRHTRVDVTLDTGRTHQIRAHFAAIGHPVAGDSRYGARSVPWLRRQFLHSARLGFAHPFTGDRLELQSPLPADLAAALDSARRADPGG